MYEYISWKNVLHELCLYSNACTIISIIECVKSITGQMFRSSYLQYAYVGYYQFRWLHGKNVNSCVAIDVRQLASSTISCTILHGGRGLWASIANIRRPKLSSARSIRVVGSIPASQRNFVWSDRVCSL